MYAPTLLIGLGGLGASIVQAVYAEVPEDRLASVRVHILDTDVNELNDGRYRKLLASHSLTQISPPTTVGRCVERLAGRTQVRQWFPGARLRSVSLDEKRMVDGAAQIRAISRLALLDSLVSGRLHALDTTLDSMRTANGFNLQHPVRVMIVNSIAGGTGSGSFLQLALYVRDYFATQLRTENVVMRGVWVMPEIFVKNGDYDSDEIIGNVRANGYASVKEFDAVTRVRANQLSPLAPLEMEFKPGGQDASQLGPGPAPLDFVFLYDYINIAGENLGGKSNYIQQVKDALYFQLFSPLQGRAGISAQEDNLILTLVRKEDRARYASSAVAKLVYPYADSVEYCALQWAAGGLSEDWLEIDGLIRDEFEQIERDKRDGLYRERPDPKARYVEILDMKATAEKARPFYRSVYRDAHLVDDRGFIGDAKSSLWLSTVDKRIAEACKKAMETASSSLHALNLDALKDKDNVVNQVESNERGLEAYRQTLTMAVQPLANMIVKEALWEDYQRNQAFDRDNELHLNTWLLGKTEAAHPVAVRYFLSQAWLAVKLELERQEARLPQLEQILDAYKTKWDDPDTDIVETAGTVAAKHASASYLRSLLKRELASFADDYQALADSQKQSIGDWAAAKVRRDVMNLLLAHLDSMLNDWQMFFRQLRDVLGDCQREIQRLAKKQDNNANPTLVYVLASERHKQALWEDVGAGMRAKDLPADIAKQIYLSLYRRHAARHFDEPQTAGVDWVAKTFREQVVGWCRGELLQTPGLDLNIKAALDKALALDQAAGGRVGFTAEGFFQEQTARLQSLAKPFVPAIPDDNALFHFWCIHPETSEALGDRLRLETLGDARIDAAFARNELAYLNMAYGLKATDLPTMNDRLGVYRRAYEERIALSREVPPKSYTPHMDWRWDSPAYLPEVDDELQARAMDDLRLAVLYSLMLDTPPVFQGQHDGEAVWRMPTAPGVLDNLTGLDGRPVAATLKGLFLGLSVHYGLVLQLMKQIREIEQERQRKGQTPLIVEKLGLGLDTVLRGFASEPNQIEAERLRNPLILSLFNAVHDQLFHASQMPATAKKAAEAVLREALAASSVFAEPGADAALLTLVERLLQEALVERRGA